MRHVLINFRPLKCITIQNILNNSEYIEIVTYFLNGRQQCDP